MPRSARLLLFSVLMFVLGISAGRALHARRPNGIALSPHGLPHHVKVDQPSPVTFGSLESDRLNSREPDSPATDPQSIFLASLSEVISDNQLKQVDPSFDQHSAASGADRNDIRDLFSEMFPAATDEQAGIWADEFADLDLEEVRFILQQRMTVQNEPRIPPMSLTLSSHSVDELINVAPPVQEWGKVLEWQTIEDIVVTDQTKAPSVESVNVLAAAVRHARRNMRGLHVPGYRAAVVLFDSADADSPNDRLTVSNRFNPGASMVTGSPLHVALPDDAALMFQLGDGSAVTRRGNFEVLSDRRIGLSVGDKEWPIFESPTLPDFVHDVRIESDGRIVAIRKSDELGQSNDATSEEELTVIGHIAVVRLLRLDVLHTTNNVVFSLPKNDNGVQSASISEAAEAELRVGAIELSNVVITEERAMLQNLEQLCAQ